MTQFYSSVRLHLAALLATAAVALQTVNVSAQSSTWNTNDNVMRINSSSKQNEGPRKLFRMDTSIFFRSNSNVRMAELSGWTYDGNTTHTDAGVRVGIGTSSPQYTLDVNGSAYFSGTISAQGLIITDKLTADTMKASDMFVLNNSFYLSAGALNQIYTTTGDLRFQSNAGNTRNVIFSAGTGGRVGIGTFSPQYKLDVAGNANVSGKLYTYRIVSNAGDSIIRLGDSTIFINYGWGNIANMNTNLNTPFKGMGIGELAIGAALHSNAMGYRVRANATNSIVLGARTSGTFINNVANSLMVGFESNLATFFVGPASGQGTVGRVGVGTSTPQSDFQVGNSFHKLSMGDGGGTNWYGTSYVGFNLAKSATNQWTATTDGFHNGGVMLQGNVIGGFRIVQIPYTQQNGGQDQIVTDQDIEDNVVFRINVDGRVEIGKEQIAGGPHANSFTKLTVDGKVVCKELFVTKYDWADSIFADEYTLMPMDSLRAFIDSTGHLPNVPTGADVKVTGSNLAQNDVMLLAKVEELTLYMLQLQEQNVQLQKRIEELEAKKEEQPK